ncbi:hypothetical protein [Gemmatimonas sp.]|uniref:hypothetical protein n=1 Tax=Gemmatimonas sp. TaxID=1962908 RepID=UPI00286EA65E|nr:hypothetical protein [Gemmatimonas sp.]
MTHRRVISGVLLAAALPWCAAAAQEVRANGQKQPPVSSRGRLPVTGCAGQPISDIIVITQPPFTDRLPTRLEWVRRTVRRTHANTRDDVVRRFLLMKVGDACNQIRRAESERILRAQPFLVDARIRVFDDEAGGVRLEVETRDDFSLVFEPTLQSKSPLVRGMRFGDSNLGGSATLAAINWRDGRAYNDLLGVDLANYAFGRGRNEFRFSAQRNRFGQDMRLELVRPYYTDLQRYAWIGGLGGTREPMEFRRGDLPRNALTVRREFANVGAVSRLGPVGRLKLLGASLTREVQRTDEQSLLLTRDGVIADTTAVAVPTFRPQRVVRANALLGVRAIRFVQVQGFDALTGAQDVRVGMQLGLVAGRSIVVRQARDRDHFVAANLYGGFGGTRSFVGLQAVTEARYDRDAKAWDNFVTSGRLAWYFRPAVRQTSVVETEWSAGRDMRVPFQLSLADREGGIMGHRASRQAGARRLVLRAEQRLVVPTRLNVADVGFAGFAEAGRLWADPSVPYSLSTPWRGAVGVSVLAAVPPRSRRLWRVDFALPISADPQRRFEVRFSSVDRSRVFWNEPRDVQAGRERTAPSSLFTWP